MAGPCRGAPTSFMFASGGIVTEGYGHDEPAVCLGDGQTEADEVPSQGGRGGAPLRRMPPYLTFPDRTRATDLSSYTHCPRLTGYQLSKSLEWWRHFTEREETFLPVKSNI